MYNVNTEKNYVISELQKRYEFDAWQAEDAFKRLARDISVFKDFVHFLKTGEYTNHDQDDSVLGHTASELITTYHLEPIGAYLMLSEIAVDPIKGEEYLKRILDEGVETIENKPDGTIVKSLTKVSNLVDEEETDPVCPKCAGDINYIEDYNRWYCHYCKEYLEEEKSHACATCNGELTWVEQYQRWYCYSCQQYAPQ